MSFKMIPSKKTLLIPILLLFTFVVAAQDAFFSQYNNSRLYVNPAFTGTDSNLIIGTGYRIQWPKLDGGYKTYYFSADQYVHFLRGGIGMCYLNDNEANGAIVTNRIDINYAPHLELFKHKIAIQPALSIGYFQKKMDWNKLSFGDQIDVRRGFIYNSNEEKNASSISNIDFSAGLLIYGENFHVGFSAFHISQPNDGFLGPEKLPIKFIFHGGYNYKQISNKLVFSPTFLFQKQNDFQMLIVGLKMKYNKIIVGINYRNKDALIGSIQYQNRFLKIGYSYDYTTSTLSNKSTGGSHEVQLNYMIKYSKKNFRERKLQLL